MIKGSGRPDRLLVRPPGQRVRQLDKALADLETGRLRKEKVDALLRDYRRLLVLLRGLGRGWW